jgi:adenylate cyclase
MPINNLFAELRRRHVFRVAGVYAVVGWLLAQVSTTMEEALSMPGWFDTVIVSMLLLCFPLAMILAWAFDMTPEGVKRTGALDPGEHSAPEPARKLDYAILAGLALVVALAAWQQLGKTEAVPVPDEVAISANVPTLAEETITPPVPPPSVNVASIAVLPFADLSAAGDQQYFTDGISEEILNVLANVDGLEVASRTSSFQFKGQEKIGIPVIAGQLRVRHILEGSVRKSGDAIRITAQLIDAETDKHLWSETYDRTLTTGNLFAIQDEITQAIVEQLSSRLAGSKTLAAPGARNADTDNTDAYALFLEGQTRFVLRGEDNILKGITALERAVEIDPGFARAWAALSANYSIAPGWFSGANLDRDFATLAKQAANQAIELDPSLALPYAVLASDAAAYSKDYEAALAYFDQAIANDPNDETTYMWRAEIWRDLGFFDRALADFDRCLALNPDYNNCRDHKSNTQIMAGDVDAGLATLDDNLRRGFDEGTNAAQWGAYLSRGNMTAFLHELNAEARSLGEGDMRWAVDMFYQAQTNPDYDRKAALEIFEARLEGMGSPLVPESFLGTAVLLYFDAFERMHPTGNSWWWGTLGFPEWANSPERKRLIKERKLDVYWRKHGFPPRCRPLGADDFECD